MRTWIDYENICINFYFDFAKEKKDEKKQNVSNQFISLIYEENVLEVLLIF